MKRIPTVRVGVYWRKDKGRYYLRWKDPFTGRRLAEQTAITTRNKRSKTKADQLALLRQQELIALMNKSDWSWDAFVARYRENHLNFTSKDNQYKWNAVAKYVDAAAEASREVVGALYLSDIRPRFLTDVELLLRKNIASGSINSYMATLRAGLSWAASEEMMDPLARRRKPPGREADELPAYRLIPISEESLQKMKDVVSDVVGKQHCETVGRYLQALWLSGCRMREPLMIHPFKRDCHRPIRLEGAEPVMYWTAEQKSKQAGVHRIPLDFATDLKLHQDANQFCYRPTCETGELLDRTALSKMVAAIGKKAEVEAEPGKTVTSKHFRTSFVQRWSDRGMPLRLVQDMVRHQDESTTNHK